MLAEFVPFGLKGAENKFQEEIVKNAQQILSVVLSVLLLATPAYPQQQSASAAPQAQAEQQPAKAEELSVEQVSQTDYKVTGPTGEMTLHLPDSRGEVDRILREEKGQGIVMPRDVPDLQAVRWHDITHWGSDPVVKGGISSMPPAPDQMARIREAIENNQSYRETEKQELIDKISTGDCQVQDSLDSRFGESMTNGGSVLWKYEVSPALAARTRNCKMYLQTANRIEYLIFACANLHRPFVHLTFVPPPVTAKPPVELLKPVRCENFAVQANGVYTAQFDGPVGQVSAILRQPGAPEYVIPVAVTGNTATIRVAPNQNFTPGTYGISLHALTPDGREIDVSACNAQGVTYTLQPPVTKEKHPRKGDITIITTTTNMKKGGCGVGCILGIAGAAVGTALVVGFTRGKKNVTVINNPPPSSEPGKTDPKGGW